MTNHKENLISNDVELHDITTTSINMNPTIDIRDEFYDDEEKRVVAKAMTQESLTPDEQLTLKEYNHTQSALSNNVTHPAESLRLDTFLHYYRSFYHSVLQKSNQRQASKNHAVPALCQPMRECTLVFAHGDYYQETPTHCLLIPNSMHTGLLGFPMGTICQDDLQYGFKEHSDKERADPSKTYRGVPHNETILNAAVNDFQRITGIDASFPKLRGAIVGSLPTKVSSGPLSTGKNPAFKDMHERTNDHFVAGGQKFLTEPFIISIVSCLTTGNQLTQENDASETEGQADPTIIQPPKKPYQWIRISELTRHKTVPDVPLIACLCSSEVCDFLIQGNLWYISDLNSQPSSANVTMFQRSSPTHKSQVNRMHRKRIQST